MKKALVYILMPSVLLWLSACSPQVADREKEKEWTRKSGAAELFCMEERRRLNWVDLAFAIRSLGAEEFKDLTPHARREILAKLKAVRQDLQFIDERMKRIFFALKPRQQEYFSKDQGEIFSLYLPGTDFIMARWVPYFAGKLEGIAHIGTSAAHEPPLCRNKLSSLPDLPFSGYIMRFLEMDDIPELRVDSSQAAYILKRLDEVYSRIIPLANSSEEIRGLLNKMHLKKIETRSPPIVFEQIPTSRQIRRIDIAVDGAMRALR